MLYVDILFDFKFFSLSSVANLGLWSTSELSGPEAMSEPGL